jgi:hypothetical protein
MKMLDADNDDEEIDETISSSAGEVQPASVEGEVGSVTGGVGDAPARDEEAGANGQKVEKDGSSERWDETLVGEECEPSFPCICYYRYQLSTQLMVFLRHAEQVWTSSSAPFRNPRSRTPPPDLKLP